jgi:hypothetical protein
LLLHNFQGSICNVDEVQIVKKLPLQSRIIIFEIRCLLRRIRFRFLCSNINPQHEVHMSQRTCCHRQSHASI